MSKSAELNLIAILSPKIGKTDRLLELMSEVAAYVEKNEPNTLKYEIMRTGKDKVTGREEVIVIEKYTTKDGLRIHGSSPTFQKFQKTLLEEGIVEGPSSLKFVRPVGGFAARL